MATERKPRDIRWGLLTLLFLGIALGCVLRSNATGHYTVVTGLGLIVGFGGAAFCSYKGVKGARWLPR